MKGIKKWIAKHVLGITWYEGPNFVVQFVPSGQGVRYFQASGFFQFNGEIFFKTDTESVGKSLTDPKVTFSRKIESMNRAYKCLSVKEIGNLMVFPLHVVTQSKIN